MYGPESDSLCIQRGCTVWVKDVERLTKQPIELL